MYLINVVCTGNICRSAMAEVVLNEEIVKQGLAGRIKVVSSGVSDEEHGNPIDPRAVRVLVEHGYKIPQHCAHQITATEINEANLILPMTHSHLRALKRMVPESDWPKIRMYRSFDRRAVKAAGGRLERLDISDPWYGDFTDFETALSQIEHVTPMIIKRINDVL